MVEFVHNVGAKCSTCCATCACAIIGDCKQITNQQILSNILQRFSWIMEPHFNNLHRVNYIDVCCYGCGSTWNQIALVGFNDISMCVSVIWCVRYPTSEINGLFKIYLFINNEYFIAVVYGSVNNWYVHILFLLFLVALLGNWFNYLHFIWFWIHT